MAQIRTRPKLEKVPINLASIDRMDLGYIDVRFVSVMYNYARNTFTDEEVLQFAKAVVNNNLL